MNLNAITESLFGSVRWATQTRGYFSCPGVMRHTNANGKRDCRVMLDGVPTIYCFHTSCSDEVGRANRRLRSAIGRVRLNGACPVTRRWQPSPADQQQRQEKETRQRLERRAKDALPTILREFATDPAELVKETPVCLPNDPLHHWQFLLKLYRCDDVVWIGGKYDSGPRHEDHFRTVSEWLRQRRPTGQYICPNTFKAGVSSRSNDNVKDRRYLVVESDTLTKAETCAIFSWCRQMLPLRAIVDTAGKSLHGWFDYPADAVLNELETILPALRCDKQLFTPSQAVRLPGAERDGKIQCLLYLDI